MSMPRIPTLRAAHLLPYLEFCYDKGLSTEHLLSKFRLPASLDAQPEARLPVLPTLKFLTHIERSACVQDIGALASRYVSLSLLGQENQRAILTAPTLRAALKACLAGAQLESSAFAGWMQEQEAAVRICGKLNVAASDEETRPLQIHFTLLMLCIVRAFIGPNWTPAVMGFRSRTPLSPVVGHLFPKTQFFFRQDHSWIDLPNEVLDAEGNWSRTQGATKDRTCLPVVLLTDDYVSTLKGMLKSYLPDGYPSIDLTAEVLGTSVRSLQRTLAQCNTTYSKVVDQTRVEAAMELLENSENKIIDVAYAVGYEDPSHFSRAFRRLKGTSPRGFRLSGAA